MTEIHAVLGPGKRDVFLAQQVVMAGMRALQAVDQNPVGVGIVIVASEKVVPISIMWTLP